MVLARPWSKGSKEAWASAKRFTKDKRDSAVTLPLVKLPKARVKVDTALHRAVVYSIQERSTPYKRGQMLTRGQSDL